MANCSVSLLTICCYIFLFFRLACCTATGIETCFATCGDMSPIVRFPFSLVNSLASSDCGLPGFSLWCKRSERANLTDIRLILKLPHLGEFLVRSINYSNQTITINDPSNCLPKRFLRSFNASGSPFRPIMDLRYTMLYSLRLCFGSSNDTC